MPYEVVLEGKDGNISAHVYRTATQASDEIYDSIMSRKYQVVKCYKIFMDGRSELIVHQFMAEGRAR